MRVFKFGGASVKDAAAVKNVANIIARYNDRPLVVVVSAMAKTTNALEKVVISRKEQVKITDFIKLNKDAWQCCQTK